MSAPLRLVIEMRPRWEPRDPKIDALLKEVQDLEERIEKASPDYGDKEGFKQGPSHFETQVGGGDSVRTAHYHTNGSTIESEDVKNKGSTVESSKVLDSATGHYPTSESTLGSHDGGSDGRSESAFSKTLGTSGDQLRLDMIRKSIGELSRRIQ